MMATLPRLRPHQIPQLLLLLLLPASAAALAGFECKNASSDWPLPCGDPSAAIEHYHLGAPTAPASATFPISAWWGPVGYSESYERKDPKPTEEFLAYAAAGAFSSHAWTRAAHRAPWGKFYVGLKADYPFVVSKYEGPNVG